MHTFSRAAVNGDVARGPNAADRPGGNQQGAAKWGDDDKNEGDSCKNGINKGVSGISRLFGAAKLQSV